MRSFALALLLVAVPASAQSRGPVAVAPGTSMTCLSVPISVIPAPTIRATDVGGGGVDLDIFVLGSDATPQLTFGRSGRDLRLPLTVPDGYLSCSVRARLTGVPPGTWHLHLERAPRSGTIASSDVTVR